jgi:hypothetical protein
VARSTSDRLQGIDSWGVGDSVRTEDHPPADADLTADGGRASTAGVSACWCGVTVPLRPGVGRDYRLR